MSSLQVDPAELLRNPDFFLHAVDVEGDAAWFARMSADSYRSSSFLDERIARAAPEPLRLPLSGLLQLVAQSAPPPRTSHYLFHVGHCGSTLLARILDEVNGLFVLREPMMLKILTELRDETVQADGRLDGRAWDELFELGRRMLARTYSESDTAVVKATSICGNLLRPCLEADADSRAVLLSVTLDTFLATMLRPQRRPELGANSRLRIRKLQALTGQDDLRFYEMSDSQKAVMNWLTTMAFFLDALRDPVLGERVKLVRFEDLLEDREGTLAGITGFLGHDMSNTDRAALVRSAHFDSYAKSPQRAFDAATRAAQLDETRKLAGDEIAAGLAWARGLCDKSEGLSGMADWLETT